jgi:hypothetical protein
MVNHPLRMLQQRRLHPSPLKVQFAVFAFVFGVFILTSVSVVCHFLMGKKSSKEVVKAPVYGRPPAGTPSKCVVSFE